jgi:signal transduction histidine kinase
MAEQTTLSPPAISLADALAKVDVFHGLGQEAIDWFASHAEDVWYKDGEVVWHQDAPADRMVVVLEGEVYGRRDENGGTQLTYVVGAGRITGMLPYSRLSKVPVTVRAVGPTRLAVLRVDQFPEMMQRIPELTARLIQAMADRIRETTRSDVQREKLAALGKLSAGLAHELNNPAAAIRRSVSSMRTAFSSLRASHAGLCAQSLNERQLEALSQFEGNLLANQDASTPEDELQRSDRESELDSWLSERGVEQSWELAPQLAEAHATVEMISGLAESLPANALSAALRRKVAILEVERAMRDVENGSVRISELVKAVKDYTYMDQNGDKEIDLHEGIESTLVMLHHRLKHGVKVIRQFDRSLPKICAFGSALNQVWTNLIDNAIDSMEEKGELIVRTARDGDRVLVEVVDNGPGIPHEIQDRIFEPFFTTKEVGEGTGLGLDIVYKIVRKHHGDIRFDSRPGRTSFQVRLPVPKSA